MRLTAGSGISLLFSTSYQVAVTHTVLVDVDHLSVGMFVHLDVGWLHHPFRSSRFRIASKSQIEVLQRMGLKSVRCVAVKSSVKSSSAGSSDADSLQPSMSFPELPEQNASIGAEEGDLQLEKERLILARCDQNFAHATDQFARSVQAVSDNLALARSSSESVVFDCVAQLLEYEEPAIFLLSEAVGERSTQHPVNVMVLCLLLGKVQGLGETELRQLGLAALLHDLGKLCLPSRLAHPVDGWSSRERALFESHVGESVALVEQMGLASEVTIAIAQHHEMADGSGFPLRLLGEDMGRAGKVLALVNRYDRLCNPANGTNALTPHEALAQLFVQCKSKFDALMLKAFIRMMGVYPPGSVVQLSDERYALVVSVNTVRPLRPWVIVYDPDVPRPMALALNLELEPLTGIRRSMKPSQLPHLVLQYLAPRQRVSYFFERALDAKTIHRDLA